MTKKEFLKNICLLKVGGREIYIPFEVNRDEYRVSYYVIVHKPNQDPREGKYIYGHVRITGPEFLASKGDLSQFKRRIKIAQEKMYKVFLEEFPRQEEELIFLKGERE